MLERIGYKSNLLAIYSRLNLTILLTNIKCKSLLPPRSNRTSGKSMHSVADCSLAFFPIYERMR